MPAKIRVLLAKVGLDPHDKGVKLVAHGLRDQGGMEIVYTGLYRTIEEIEEKAIENQVNVIGISVHTGQQMNIFPRLRQNLDNKGLKDIILIGGGVISAEDVKALTDSGTVGEIFGPSTPINTIIDWIKQAIEDRKPI